VFSRFTDRRLLVMESAARPVVSSSPWTSRASAADNSWFGVAYSPALGRLLACATTGTGDRLMYSDNGGLTWTAQASPSEYQWRDLMWVAAWGLFVVCAANADGNDRIITSPSGLTGSWTTRTTPVIANSQWVALAYAPTLGRAVGMSAVGNINHTMWSDDGITWTLGTAPAGPWLSVAWSPTLALFAAVGSGGVVATSSNGQAWTPRVSPEANTWASVDWSPSAGVFVAVSTDGTSRVMSSTDGITWTARTAAVQNQWRAVRYIAGIDQFVAVAITGTSDRAMRSANGITWTSDVTPLVTGDND
jgi:hypothetical protein